MMLRDLNQTPQNWMMNQDTGAMYDLGPSRDSGPALDFASGPVEYMGQKGYRLAGDPFTVQLANGQRLRLGEDTGAGIARDASRQKMMAGQLANEQTALENQAKRLTIADLTQGMTPTDNRMAQMGVPLPPNDPYAGMSRKGRENLQGKEITQAEKRLAEEQANARGSQAMAQDAEQFKALNERTSTGPISGSAPAAFVRGIFDPDIQTMRSISDRLTPKMREPGSGATSDFDARMFQSALFGVNKNPESNRAIADAMILKAKAEKDRVSFMESYLAQNNTLRGADSAWTQYAEANPIFDPASKDTPKINPARQPWRQYFSGGRKESAAPAGGNIDAQAYDWARKNINDPRAMAILKSMGK